MYNGKNVQSNEPILMRQAGNIEKFYNPLYLIIVPEKHFPALGVIVEREEENKLMKSISSS